MASDIYEEEKNFTGNNICSSALILGDSFYRNDILGNFL
jgi:hypothetical protein